MRPPRAMHAARLMHVGESGSRGATTCYSPVSRRVMRPPRASCMLANLGVAERRHVTAWEVSPRSRIAARPTPAARHACTSRIRVGESESRGATTCFSLGRESQVRYRAAFRRVAERRQVCGQNGGIMSNFDSSDTVKIASIRV